MADMVIGSVLNSCGYSYDVGSKYLVGICVNGIADTNPRNPGKLEIREATIISFMEGGAGAKCKIEGVEGEYDLPLRCLYFKKRHVESAFMVDPVTNRLIP